MGEERSSAPQHRVFRKSLFSKREVVTTPCITVVLVGQNPTPALLSALTLPSTHLTLIASDDTAPAAHRVAGALERLSPFPRSIRVLSVGPDPHDPRRVYKTLEHFHTKTGGRPGGSTTPAAPR